MSHQVSRRLDGTFSLNRRVLLSNSQLAFPDLAIQGFRGFRDLIIPQLGRVTLITGKNHAGKSSILEALRIGARKAEPAVVFDTLRTRAGYRRGSKEDTQFLDFDSDFFFSDLFHGFPALDDEFGPIVIKTSNPKDPVELSMHVEWMSFTDDSQSTVEFVDRNRIVREEIPGGPVLVARTKTDEFVVRLGNLRSFPDHMPRPDSNRMTCKFVKANGTSEPLGRMWDRAVLRDEEEEVVRALRVIEPNIAAVRMIGGDDRYRPVKTPYIRVGSLSRYVSILSSGDGLNRMFTLILALLDARGGLLLIDEFENGLHYTVQPEAWRTIFQLAERHSIQVVATTHSWDAVEAFQVAAAATPEVGVLLRLTRRGNDVIPTVFSEDDLQVITKSRIEVR